MAYRNKTLSLRHEGHMFFIYNHKKKTEEDDPKDAILYFYPRSVSVDDQVALVGGIIGIADFCQEFLPECIPTIVKLAGHNFALLQHEEYIIGLADSLDVPERFLTSHMNFVWSTFMFYQGSLESLRERVSDINFLKELSRIWDMYLPLCQIHGDILSQAFHVLPYVQLHKCQSSLFLHASHILQRSLRHKGVIAGALFNKNKVLCSQLSNTLTRQLLLLMSPSQFPCVEANSLLELPGGVRLLYIYLSVQELSQLGHRRSKVYGNMEQSQPVGSLKRAEFNSGSQNVHPAAFFSDTSSGSELPREGRKLSFNRNMEVFKPLSPTATITSGTDSEVFLDTLSELNFDTGQQLKLGDIKEVACSPSSLVSPSKTGKSTSDLLPSSTKHQQTGKQDAIINARVEPQQNSTDLISSDTNLSLSEDVDLKNDILTVSLNGVSTSPSVFNSSTGNICCDTKLVETNSRNEVLSGTNEADIKSSDLSKATMCGYSTVCVDFQWTTESLSRDEHGTVTSENSQTSFGEECNLQLNIGLNSSVADAPHHPVIDVLHQSVTVVPHQSVTDTPHNTVTDLPHQPVTEISNNSVTELTNNPVTDVSNNPAADLSNNLVSDDSKTTGINHISSNPDGSKEKERTNLKHTLMRSKEDIDASLEVCFSGEDSSTPSSSTQSSSGAKFNDPQGSLASLDCAEISFDKDRLTFEVAESEHSECGVMSPLPGRLSELSSLSVDDVKVISGLASESDVRMTKEADSRSTHSLSDASSSKNLITKSILQRSGLEEITLYAQGHSDTLLVLFLSRNTKSEKSYINSLWKSCLPHLAELDFEVKDAERHFKDDNESIGSASQYMRYDSFTQSLKGSALLPVTSLANEIVDSSVRMHQCFTSMPQLQDITYRSHSACCYGHKTVNSETFFQLGLTKSVGGIYDDKTFKLDQIAQKELVKDRKVCML